MLGSSILRNRFTLTFAGLALVAVVWNVYVAANAGGQVDGRVLNGAGQPVAGATVVLSRKTVASVEKVSETRTDADGRYRFDRHGQYAIVLSAQSNDSRSQPLRLPLLFRNQNVAAEPLVLEP